MLLLQDPPVPDDVVVDEGKTVVVVGAAVLGDVVDVGDAVGDVVEESPVQSSSPLKLTLMTLGS